MRRVSLAALLLLATVSPAAAAPAEAPSKIFQPQDIFGLEYAGDPQISADGKTVAYVRNSYDIMTDRAKRAIWTIDVASGAHSPLVAGVGSYGSPRWSPDGKRLAYVSTEEGRPQLFVRWMGTGEAVRVASLPQSPGSIAWSPDGQTIAFSMFVPSDAPKLGAPLAKPEGAQWAEPLKVTTEINYKADGQGVLRTGFTHVFTVSADGGAPRQLTFGEFDDRSPLSWALDSRSILLSARRGDDWRRNGNSEVYKLSAVDGTLTALTNRNGPDDEPTVSPDGKLIAYTGYDDKLMGYHNRRLYVMNADGSNSRVLTGSLDRSVGSPQWAADGKSIYVDYDDEGMTKVGRVTLDGRFSTVAAGLTGEGMDRPYSGGAFSVADNGAIAVTVGTPTQPSDIAVVQAGKTRQFTRLNQSLFAGKTLAKVEPLAVKSSFDQRPIGAWIATPPNFDPSKKYPLILEIHGGPFSAYGPAFATDVQLYAAAGYVVLYTNPRGSTSYGEEFANLIHHNYPSQDYDDLISAVDAAIAKGFVDPDNLFVTGGSGGGVLTAWIIGKTNRFKAAAVQKPVINWSSQILTSDGAVTQSKYWFGKMPWEDPEGYWKRSPLSLVGNVTTPTMVVVGEQDMRTPVSEAEQYYTALQIRKVPTTLVKVPGAGHGSFAARPSQSAAKTNAILAWFERYRAKN